MKIKRIETERLVLREFVLEDAKMMFKNWAKDPQVTKYMTWQPHKNVEETKSIIQMWLNEYDDPKTHRFAITLKKTGEIIGSIDVVNYINGCPEIGYCSARKCWNKGYMTEAVTAFIKYLFDEGFKRIVIEAHVDNIGSNRVIQKCGFTFSHQEEKKHFSAFKPEPVLVNWYYLEK